MSHTHPPILVTICTAVLLVPLTVAAQKLPAPSRTVYKCEERGRVTYSDSPCLDAQKLEVEPTRGMDSSSGRARTGADVQREKQRELLSDAVRPLAGPDVDGQRLDRLGRRMQLPAESQRACGALDRSIPALEQRAAQPTHIAEQRQAVAQELLAARQAFRAHRCD